MLTGHIAKWPSRRASPIIRAPSLFDRPVPMHALVNIAVRAARAAGARLVRDFEKYDAIKADTKGRNDHVSETDHAAERVIIESIRKSYPEHAFLAEESGAQGETSAEVTWIIDPLDGTTNFLHGLPHFAISIAAQIKGRVEHGVIYDPLRDELFTASRGGGAAVNGKRIRVGNTNRLEQALLATAFPFHNAISLDRYLGEFQNIYPRCADIRRNGSAALDLAYVAAGRFDGYWEYGVKIWDIAAGALLVQEAGGLLTDMNGGSDIGGANGIVCANPKLFKQMVQAFKGVY